MANTATMGAFVDDGDAQAIYLAAKRRMLWRRRLLPLITLLAILVIWEVSVRVFGIRPFIAPAPSAVFAVLVNKFPMLMQNLLPTAIEAISGFIIGNLAAIAIATAFAYKDSLEEAFFPIAVMVNTIPVVAKAPILVLLLGNGMEPKIAIAALICFFPTLVNMIRGLEAASANEQELFRILSASKSEIFWKLRLPRSLPMLFSSLRIASATAVIGAIVGEWIGSERGLGALIIQATFNYQSDRLYAAIVLSSAMSIALFGAVVAVERRIVSPAGSA
jgi:NitT/TauT family transport system permease protein